ncbi:50S ribosomal protein L3 N(5)-glutamine methyltransferase [Ectothiorhodospiraceae bacterium BW-2]|nr:50S ribosomal protein L3 N(5)-glutamine methyltransferase [Ectothiorhodospiraceae bacterium BW-2]
MNTLSRSVATEVVTLADAIRWGASEFTRAQLCFGHGSDNALDEARYLVLFALNLPFQLPDSYLQSRLTGPERERVVQLLQRRISTRQPAAYLTGEAWFAGLRFEINKQVLIPRSPLAELIEVGYAPWVEPESLESMLELCTGSGCIAIASALALPEVAITASDISPAALAVAEHNRQRHGVESQLELVESDLFTALASKRFDLIVANPPYVESDEMAALPPEYRHEPVLALASGADGLDIVRRILAQANDYLTDNGVLIIEVGASQHHVEQLYPQLPLTWIEFERGGHGVFTLTAAELAPWRHLFAN